MEFHQILSDFGIELSPIGYLSHNAWVGVDIDGTWADNRPDDCRFYPYPIGPEIVEMSELVRQIQKYFEVKAFTARAGTETGRMQSRIWLDSLGFNNVQITNRKDYDMIFYLDDRAVSILANTGKPPKCGRCGTSLDLRNKEVP